MTRRAARQLHRAGTTLCEVCHLKRPLVEHHIDGRAAGNARWNVCWICPNCHDDQHAVPQRLRIHQWAMTTGGRELLWTRTPHSADNL